MKDLYNIFLYPFWSILWDAKYKILVVTEIFVLFMYFIVVLPRNLSIGQCHSEVFYAFNWFEYFLILVIAVPILVFILASVIPPLLIFVLGIIIELVHLIPSISRILSRIGNIIEQLLDTAPTLSFKAKVIIFFITVVLWLVSIVYLTIEAYLCITI